jgi:hypothetical protein
MNGGINFFREYCLNVQYGTVPYGRISVSSDNIMPPPMDGPMVHAATRHRSKTMGYGMEGREAKGPS